VRKAIRAWLIGAACAAVATAGCAKVESCSVSPIEIEELREDIGVIDKDLEGVHDREQQLADDLAAKQADLNSKKDKPAELRARLDLLKRGSGRIEKKKTDDKKSAPKSGATTGGKKESS
jgi:chromosome segregation ATPase